ncbi:ATP-binding protein [Pyrococcus abyssi]|uniref:ATPase of the AAA superfamily n=1 Tax=Pyrococcus abyssi (strain GE5 / Orsay) TaxID=272844 RepID=Q9V2E1_PYRAB|nr:ATP-binding protein [Pyrococcus abyssi]CAB49057.1 ATPase of the AAA superfamily [Pyrococcus abyssi GE5]CCE69509.1 TPA: DEXX-box ATPase [Pyrococcus abyssi GE5]
MDLEEYNPWWFHEEDPDIEEWNTLEYKYMPSWIRELSLEPFSVNFIIGPRRVGKTLGVKLLIKQLLENRISNPYEIFYYDCTMLDDQNDLLDVLRAYLKLKESKRIKSSLIFLDEVTSVRNWWKGIIDLINRKKLRNDVVVIMGSVLINLDRSIGHFAGRRGNGKILEIMPLGFRDYYQLIFGVEEYFERKGQEAFEMYLKTGGYAAYLNRRIRKSDIVGSLKADLRSLEREKDPETAREILGAIISKAPSPVSYSELARDVGINRDTVRSYISVLVELKILLEIPFSEHGKMVLQNKNRKIAIRDPLMARALAEWAKVKLEDSVLYEWVVQEHLYRKFREIYYFMSENYEIDAVVPGMRVEVKSGKSLGRRYPSDVIILTGRDVPRFLHAIQYHHALE